MRFEHGLSEPGIGITGKSANDEQLVRHFTLTAIVFCGEIIR